MFKYIGISMKKLAFLLVVFCLLNQSLFSDIKKLPGQFSLMLNISPGLTFGVSNSMKGTIESVESDYLKYGDYTQFPFDDGSTAKGSARIELSYRIPNSHFSPYLSLYSTFFSVDNDLRGLWVELSGSTPDIRGSLSIGTFSFGTDYSIGELDDLFNAFVKGGVCFSIVGGDVLYKGNYADIRPVFRMGFETEIGGRINIPSTPLSFETSFGYTNVNLIGKSRDDDFTYQTEINLNDKEDSENNIPNKTIDYLSLKFGLRLWF